MIGGIAYIVPAFVYAIFGSGEVQSWNEISDVVDNENVKSSTDKYNKAENTNTNIDNKL